MSKLTRTSILLAVFFGIDKILAILRSVIVQRQFGISKAFDVFNVANNIPDLLFALISGGALAMAFIPVLTEVITNKGREDAWDLFSRIANLAFISTAALAIVVALLAEPIVRGQFGVAPGFGRDQQNLVIELMRLNLIATLIFSISGLVMAGLQANQQFLLPALAPILYNVGQIFGAVILSPEHGYSFGGITLPAFGMGVYGLVYGVILGAVLHLGIQIPGLLIYRFHWIAKIGVKTELVRKVLRLIGPRLGTMFCIQLIFIIRDNLASRLQVGAPGTLTIGWMIMQVPETLIGTAIGIALLPTLSELAARQEGEEFRATLQRATQVIVAVTLPVAVVLMFGLPPLLETVFRLNTQEASLLIWVTRGFLVGLTGQCLMEVAVRSFYARQDAITPLVTAGINLLVYVLLALGFYRWLGAPGISLADSLAFTSQAVILLTLLNRRLVQPISPQTSLLRALAAAILGGAVVFGISQLPVYAQQPLVMGVVALALGGIVALLPIHKEIRLLLRL